MIQLKNNITPTPLLQHPSVWFEMKRYFRQGWLLKFDEELHEIFNEVPETLDW